MKFIYLRTRDPCRNRMSQFVRKWVNYNCCHEANSNKQYAFENIFHDITIFILSKYSKK